MFESLMFWKKKEEPSASFSANSLSSSFNPLDVPSAPGFGDANGANSGFGASTGFGAGMNTGMPTGMGSSTPQAYPTGFDSSSSMGSASSTDPFGNPMQTAPTGFGQSAFSGASGMMQQLQMAQNVVPTNPISTLPSRSTPADPNAIHPRDVELILSRLELIRAEIENVNHRLSNLEQNVAMRSAGSGAPGQKNKAWY